MPIFVISWVPMRWCSLSAIEAQIKASGERQISVAFLF